MTVDAVRVELGARAYEVRIGPGLIARAGAEIAPLLRRPKVAILTDETVAGLHLDPFRQALAEAGIASSALALPAGEATKAGRSSPAPSNGCSRRRSSGATWWWRWAAG